GDGISEVGRQLVRALVRDGVAVTGYALRSGAPADRELAGARFVGAGGSRLRLAATVGAQPGAIEAVIVNHINLLPVTLPLQWRGARVALMLHGIEAWRQAGALKAHMIRRGTTLIAVSQHTADRFK